MNKSAKLTSDQVYLTAHEKISSFPFSYHTDLAPTGWTKSLSQAVVLRSRAAAGNST